MKGKSKDTVMSAESCRLVQDSDKGVLKIIPEKGN